MLPQSVLQGPTARERMSVRLGYKTPRLQQIIIAIGKLNCSAEMRRKLMAQISIYHVGMNCALQTAASGNGSGKI
jgi:hypothetical protein